MCNKNQLPFTHSDKPSFFVVGVKHVRLNTWRVCLSHVDGNSNHCPLVFIQLPKRLSSLFLLEVISYKTHCSIQLKLIERIGGFWITLNAVSINSSCFLTVSISSPFLVLFLVSHWLEYICTGPPAICNKKPSRSRTIRGFALLKEGSPQIHCQIPPSLGKTPFHLACQASSKLHEHEP